MVSSRWIWCYFSSGLVHGIFLHVDAEFLFWWWIGFLFLIIPLRCIWTAFSSLMKHESEYHTAHISSSQQMVDKSSHANKIVKLARWGTTPSSSLVISGSLSQTSSASRSKSIHVAFFSFSCHNFMRTTLPPPGATLSHPQSPFIPVFIPR